MIDVSSTALNLSYVLHEPSQSPQVAACVRECDSATQRVRRVAQRLAKLSDDELVARTVVRVRQQGGRGNPPGEHGLVSVRLGAWELLGRVAGIWFHANQRGRLRPEISFLDGPIDDTSATLPFFRAPARLSIPYGDEPADASISWWFACLVVRPGATSLLLDLATLNAHRNKDDWSPIIEAAIAPAEEAIRAHVDQWYCPRALWERPAELALPEFGTAR